MKTTSRAHRAAFNTEICSVLLRTNMVNPLLIWSTRGAVRPHKSKAVCSVRPCFSSSRQLPSPFCSSPYRAAPSRLPACPAWRTKLGVLARKKQHWAFYRYIIQDKPGYWLTTYEWVWGFWCKSVCWPVCTEYRADMNVLCCDVLLFCSADLIRNSL